MIHSSYELLSDRMDLILGIIALVIAFVGLIIAGLNLYINELNRRIASFRLAFDLRNFREDTERKGFTDNCYFMILLFLLLIQEVVFKFYSCK